MAATAVPDGSVLEDRIRAATLRCIARWGVSKTTLDDVAREAGCSRATIYRTVAGGKVALIDDVVRTEMGRFVTEVEGAAEAATDLEELLVATITTASRFVSEHDAFQFMLAHEPDSVLPYLAFDRLDLAFRAAETFLGPHLARVLPPGAHARVAEWIARVIVTYTITPSDSVDLSREADARHLVRVFLLPGLTAPSPEPVLTGA